MMGSNSHVTRLKDNWLRRSIGRECLYEVCYLHSSQPYNKSTGGVLKHNPVTFHPCPLDATTTSMWSAFHLRELPLGGWQTSPELLCVCSSHPCRAVSLTQNPLSLVQRSLISVPLEPGCVEAETKWLKLHYTVTVHCPELQKHWPGHCSLELLSL